METFAYAYIEKTLVSGLEMIKLIPFSEISIPVLLQFLAVGVITGVIGSCISIGKYLKS